MENHPFSDLRIGTYAAIIVLRNNFGNNHSEIGWRLNASGLKCPCGSKCSKKSAGEVMRGSLQVEDRAKKAENIKVIFGRHREIEHNAK